MTKMDGKKNFFFSKIQHSMTILCVPVVLTYNFIIYLKIIFYGLFWFRNYFLAEISELDFKLFLLFSSAWKTKNKPFGFFGVSNIKCLNRLPSAPNAFFHKYFVLDIKLDEIWKNRFFAIFGPEISKFQKNA